MNRRTIRIISLVLYVIFVLVMTVSIIANLES